MPTRTTDNPFTPYGAPERALLLRYVRGELSAAEQHAVERALEHDPLLREAVEGLRMPGALAALNVLDLKRPSPGVGSHLGWMIGGGVLLLAVVGWWFLRPAPAVPVAPEAAVPVLASAPATPAEEAAFEAELDRATALPETLRSTAQRPERFVQTSDPLPPVERTEPPAHLDPIEPTVAIDPPAAGTVASIPRHAPRKLMFFFDLKLVHPSELYPVDPVVQLAQGSVDARYSSAPAGSEGATAGRSIPYDRYFRAALGRFSRGDRQGCLEDLFVVLDQHPDDVNALFYAGLCCYDLGLFPRAVKLLDRARTNRVDAFSEEAEWYQALATERAVGRSAAMPLMNAVIERNGFYADRARKHLAGQADK